MKPMTRTLLILGTGGALVAAAVMLGNDGPSRAARFAPKPPIVQTVVVPPEPAKPAPIGDNRIQVAILLDTSGSMDGLIDQAKSQLWKIVNQFAQAKKDGKRPKL